MRQLRELMEPPGQQNLDGAALRVPADAGLRRVGRAHPDHPAGDFRVAFPASLLRRRGAQIEPIQIGVVRQRFETLDDRVFDLRGVGEAAVHRPAPIAVCSQSDAASRISACPSSETPR